jgi:hypothetical protein
METRHVFNVVVRNSQRSSQRCRKTSPLRTKVLGAAERSQKQTPNPRQTPNKNETTGPPE